MLYVFLCRRSATKLKESAERTDVAESRRPVLFSGGEGGWLWRGTCSHFRLEKELVRNVPASSIKPSSSNIFLFNFWVSWFHVCFLLLCFSWLIVFFPAYLGAWLCGFIVY